MTTCDIVISYEWCGWWWDCDVFFGSLCTVPQELKTDEFTTRMKELEEFLKSEMHFAQAKYETVTNRHRVPALSYQVGNKVWLSTKNL